jgi:hypothetical protein
VAEALRLTLKVAGSGVSVAEGVIQIGGRNCHMPNALTTPLLVSRMPNALMNPLLVSHHATLDGSKTNQQDSVSNAKRMDANVGDFFPLHA